MLRRCLWIALVITLLPACGLLGIGRPKPPPPDTLRDHRSAATLADFDQLAAAQKAPPDAGTLQMLRRLWLRAASDGCPNGDDRCIARQSPDRLKKLADWGDAEAEYLYGLSLTVESDNPYDWRKDFRSITARDWYARAAVQGLEKAQTALRRLDADQLQSGISKDCHALPVPSAVPNTPAAVPAATLAGLASRLAQVQAMQCVEAARCHYESWLPCEQTLAALGQPDAQFWVGQYYDPTVRQSPPTAILKYAGMRPGNALYDSLETSALTQYRKAAAQGHADARAAAERLAALRNGSAPPSAIASPAP